MTNATTKVEAASARRFFLPLMAASAAIALMTGFAGAAKADAPRPAMVAEAGVTARPASLIVKVDYRGDRPERNRNARGNQRGNDRNRYDQRRENRYDNHRHDRRFNPRRDRWYYGNRGYYAPRPNWRAPARWRNVRGRIVSVGRGRHSNCFRVMRNGQYYGRPALVTVRYCDTRYGNPYKVRGSKRLIRYTYNTGYRY